MNETIVIKKMDKMYGGYDYIEFNQSTMEYADGNSRAHRGHGNVLLYIEVSSKKELRDKEELLIGKGYAYTETFSGGPTK